jgi:hypothetical protein
MAAAAVIGPWRTSAARARAPTSRAAVGAERLQKMLSNISKKCCNILKNIDKK